MRIKHQLHIAAFSEVAELLILASLLALSADLGWVLYDYIIHGIPFYCLAIIPSLLIGALILTATALKRHHDYAVRCKTRRWLQRKLGTNNLRLRRLNKGN